MRLQLRVAQSNQCGLKAGAISSNTMYDLGMRGKGCKREETDGD